MSAENFLVLTNLLNELNNHKWLGGEKLTFRRSYKPPAKGHVFSSIPRSQDGQRVLTEVEEYLEPLKELIEKICLSEELPLLNISMNRNTVFSSAIKAVGQQHKYFGHNRVLEGKVVRIQSDAFEIEELSCLTGLRVTYVSSLLEQLLKVSGATIVKSKSLPENAVRFFVTQRSYCDLGDIQILVGPVLSPEPVVVKGLRKNRIDQLLKKATTSRNQNIGESYSFFIAIWLEKFELLHSAFQRAIVPMSEDIEQNSLCKNAIFISYNYARLHTICGRFNKMVSNQICPPLPSVDDLDLTLALDKDSWNLICAVLSWPDVIRHSLDPFPNKLPKLHLIFSFLSNLAHDFSLFYRNQRVLTDTRPHLMPQMFARIHLLKTLLQVFENAFAILKVIPPPSM